MKLLKAVSEFLSRARIYRRNAVDISPIKEKDYIDLAVPFVCAHGPTTHELEVTVFGVLCRFPDSPYCVPCTQEYLNRVSTLCDVCGRPIFPTNPVGLAFNGGDHPYVHLTFQCCASGAFYCGKWGEGRLITLHELDPQTYPPGTSCVAAHAVRIGEVHVTNVD